METVRDRMWIFTVFGGGDNNFLEDGGYGRSRMTPAEGAFYLNVPNLLFIRKAGIPLMKEYPLYAESFRPLQKVIWSERYKDPESVVNENLDVLMRLKADYPNTHGLIMDDFFSHSPPAYDLPALKTRHAKMKDQLELWVVIYSHELLDTFADHLNEFDMITFWTWNYHDLKDLESNLKRLKQIASPESKISLGLYMYDFPNRCPVPLEVMETQCRTAVNLLKEGEITDIIFEANTVLDLGFESVAFVREWIQEVGPQSLSS